jgi:hypothetical protein
MRYDFAILKQHHYTIFKAISGGAKIWAWDHWGDNLRQVTVDQQAELTQELEKLGFTVGEVK